MAAHFNLTQDKYDTERSKRRNATTFHKRTDILRDPALADLGGDPWVDYDEVAKQPPVLQNGSTVKFLIVGGGHAGLLYSSKLVEAGFSAQEMVIIDKAGGFGGTWYWNRYPGLCCDIEGYCYLPLLEETGYVPTWRYSRGEEIRKNAEIIADKFGLRGMFCTKFIGAEWDEEKRRWTVSLQRDLGGKHDELNHPFHVSAQFLIAAPGTVPNPSAPTLPGFQDFLKEKAVWHTARWNYDYTGGSQEDPRMVHLKDKIVGIIGTGATAVQVVPELAKWVKHLYVFQRTPMYCGPQPQAQTTPELWASVARGPGWQNKRMENLDKFYSNDPDARENDNWVDDGRTHWPAIAATFGSRRAKDVEPGRVQEHIEDFLRLERPMSDRIREHIARTVKDPVTAEKLTPWYPGWCKRPAYHPSYLETFNLPNVTLVDTAGQGVQAYTADGIVTGSGTTAQEYPVDALVLATGYMVEGLGGLGIPDGDEQVGVVAGYRGRRGRQLTEKWNSEEFGTVFGLATHGFPNMFFQTMSNIGISGNSTPAYVKGSRLVAHLIKTAMEKADAPDTLVLEATKEGEDRWTGEVEKGADWFAGLGICTPTWFTGYQRLEDKPPRDRLRFRRHGLWPAGPLDYSDIIHGYIQAGSLEGFTISK